MEWMDHGVSCEKAANLRGLSFNPSPAKTAGLLASVWLANSPTDSTMMEQSVAKLQLYGRRSTCHLRDRYGVPKEMTFLRARASANGADDPLISAKAPISSAAVLASARSEEHTSELQSIMRISYA